MAKPPSAGEMKHAVAFDARASINDGKGNRRGDWVEQFEARAAYRHLRGGESVVAARLEGQHPQVVWLHASSRSRSITADWRMRDTRTGVAYAIRDVTLEEDGRWVGILVVSGVAP